MWDAVRMPAERICQGICPFVMMEYKTIVVEDKKHDFRIFLLSLLFKHKLV
jgi:hypothetical protein